MVVKLNHGEYNAWDARMALDVVAKVHVEGEPVTPEDLDLDGVVDVADALACYRAADAQARHARAVADAAGQRLAELLGNGGAARLGDTVYRYRRSRTERCINPTGFIDYLTREVEEGRVDLADVMNPNDAKRSWMDEAVRQTFYDYEVAAEPSLQATPIDRAPKWLQEILVADGDAYTKEER